MIRGFAVFGSLFGKKINLSGPSSTPQGTLSDLSQVEIMDNHHSPDLKASGSAFDMVDAIEGLTVESYAEKRGISSEQVWEKLRRGELVGRTSRGKVLVYESIGAAAMAVPPTTQTPKNAQDGDLPPVELGGIPGALDHHDTPQQSLMALESSGALQNSTELALLLDHLSLAKEENREILRLTQDTLTKLSSMTDAVVQMKDEVIKSKDVQLAELRRSLAEKEENISKLRQEKEDLEMLNRTLGQAVGID
jgi:hypothetical protein